MNDQNRSNALLVTWDGTGRYAGDVYANYDFSTNTGEKLATEAYVNEHGGGGGGSSDEYALKTDTVLETTLSRGRKADTTVGHTSFAFGAEVTASGIRSVALGYETVASGQDAYAEGARSNATGSVSHAEGIGTTASGQYSHAECSNSTASGEASHAEGKSTANGRFSHAEGYYSKTNAFGSHSSGTCTVANGESTFVIGNGNIIDEVLPEWDASTAYKVGDKVTHDGMGCECVRDTTSDRWNSYDWKYLHRNSQEAFIIGNGSC
jgi:hypothetical protein